MEAFYETGFTKVDLIKLNQCRLYLQVVTLADILDRSGDKVYNMALLGRRNR